jgi:hypothetical protein
MKANGWILDENKGVDIGRKQTSGFWMKKGGYWMKENRWILDEKKGMDIG